MYRCTCKEKWVGSALPLQDQDYFRDPLPLYPNIFYRRLLQIARLSLLGLHVQLSHPPQWWESCWCHWHQLSRSDAFSFTQIFLSFFQRHLGQKYDLNSWQLHDFVPPQSVLFHSNQSVLQYYQTLLDLQPIDCFHSSYPWALLPNLASWPNCYTGLSVVMTKLA